jgi:hypothetical protein
MASRNFKGELEAWSGGDDEELNWYYKLLQ